MELTKIFYRCIFERVCDAQVEWQNALNLWVAHPLKKINYSVVYDFKLILYISKINTVAGLIAAKSCVSEVKLCFRNSQIPYLKANSIFKKSFVRPVKFTMGANTMNPDQAAPKGAVWSMVHIVWNMGYQFEST